MHTVSAFIRVLSRFLLVVTARSPGVDLKTVVVLLAVRVEVVAGWILEVPVCETECCVLVYWLVSIKLAVPIWLYS